MLPDLDRLSALLERFRVHAHLFHAGPLCGIQHFPPEPGRGFLHVLRRGELEIRHDEGGAGLPRRLRLAEPSLIFYPLPVGHDFHNPPRDGSDFCCATVDFDGGAMHPLVRSLPPLIVVPLAEVRGLEQALDLLFAETEQVQCGQRLLADRLFEVVVIQLLRWLIQHPEHTGLRPGLWNGLAEPRLARALTAVHEDPARTWTLAAMAREAGMSRSAFAAAFKETVGMTPAEYLADWRVALAQARLRQGQAIKIFAQQLGYANPSALSRVFTARTGMSPRLWLKSLA